MAYDPAADPSSSQGPGTLSDIDQIVILGVALPLAEMPSGGIELSIDKKKSPGSDYHVLTGKGYEPRPIRIVLRLWRDLRSGIDWFEVYGQVHGALMPRAIDKRNAVSVYHPFLAMAGVNSIIVTKRGFPRHEGRQFFTLEIEGEDPNKVKFGKGGTKRAKNDTELKSKAQKARDTTAQTSKEATANTATTVGSGTQDDWSTPAGATRGKP